MKIAVYGQYYKDNTEEIIEKLLSVFERFNPEIAFESNFYDVLNEQGLLKKKFSVFTGHEGLDSGFQLLVCVGGDGTMLRAATLVRTKNNSL